MSTNKKNVRTCICGNSMIRATGQYVISAGGILYNVTPTVWKCPRCHNEKIATSEFRIYENNDPDAVMKIGGNVFGGKLAKHVCTNCGNEMTVSRKTIRTAFLKEESVTSPDDFDDKDLPMFDISVDVAGCSSCGQEKIITGKVVVFENNDPANTLKEAREPSGNRGKFSADDINIPDAETRANSEMSSVDADVDPGEDPHAEENGHAYDPGEPDIEMPEESPAAPPEPPEPPCEEVPESNTTETDTQDPVQQTPDAEPETPQNEAPADVSADEPDDDETYEANEPTEKTAAKPKWFDGILSRFGKKKEDPHAVPEEPPRLVEIKGDVLYSTEESDFICSEKYTLGYGASANTIKRWFYKTKKGRFFSVDVSKRGQELSILDESQMKAVLAKNPDLYRRFISDFEV